MPRWCAKEPFLHTGRELPTATRVRGGGLGTGKEVEDDLDLLLGVDVGG